MLLEADRDAGPGEEVAFQGATVVEIESLRHAGLAPGTGGPRLEPSAVDRQSPQGRPGAVENKSIRLQGSTSTVLTQIGITQQRTPKGCHSPIHLGLTT